MLVDDLVIESLELSVCLRYAFTELDKAIVFDTRGIDVLELDLVLLHCGFEVC